MEQLIKRFGIAPAEIVHDKETAKKTMDQQMRQLSETMEALGERFMGLQLRRINANPFSKEWDAIAKRMDVLVREIQKTGKEIDCLILEEELKNGTNIY